VQAGPEPLSAALAVERWNLAQELQAFAQNPPVKQHLTELGNERNFL
jgi:hypothetical protein